MWLIEIEINGTVHHTSNEVVEDSRLSHIYWNAVMSMDEIRVAQDRPWGGVARAEFGAVTFRPDLFVGADWPPPVSCPLSIRYLSDDGTVFPSLMVYAHAHLASYSREGVTYQLIAADPFDEIDTDRLYQGTLVEVFAAAVARFSGWILISAGARSPSPPVNHLASGSKPLLDNLSEMAAFHAHRVVIDAEIRTVYLFDCTANFMSSAVDESTYMSLAISGPHPWRAYEALYELRAANLYQLRPTAVQDPSSWAVEIAEIQIQTDPEGAMRAPTAIGSDPAGTTGHEAPKAADGSAATFWQVAFDPVAKAAVLEVATGNVSMISYQLTAINAWSAPTRWELSCYDPNALIYRSLGEVKAREAWTAGSQQSFAAGAHQFPITLESGAIAHGEVVNVAPVVIDTYGDILSALYYIKAAVERIRVTVTMPVGHQLPHIGQYINVGSDSGLPTQTTTYLRADEILYNMDNSTCQISGFGGYL